MAEEFDRRRSYSEGRLVDLRHDLRHIEAVKSYPNLAIYAAGSYARGEASEYSDIDLFFIHDDREAASTVDDPRMRTMTMMSGVIDQMEKMALPPPSNDGEYLKILSLSKILEHLGGVEDDHQNFFTARMLLILESSPLYGAATYDKALDAVIDAYFRDYEDHAANFRPTFLVNDVLRFWKTLCLNYENRRNQADEANKIKQKIRNFKLGYSRLLTCFATVALLSSYNNIGKEEVVLISKMPPVDRLRRLFERNPSTRISIGAALRLYHKFLDRTALPKADLEEYFKSKENRTSAFDDAKRFGDEIYRTLKITSDATGTLRYLVV